MGTIVIRLRSRKKRIFHCLDISMIFISKALWTALNFSYIFRYLKSRYSQWIHSYCFDRDYTAKNATDLLQVVDKLLQTYQFHEVIRTYNLQEVCGSQYFYFLRQNLRFQSKSTRCFKQNLCFNFQSFVI